MYIYTPSCPHFFSIPISFTIPTMIAVSEKLKSLGRASIKPSEPTPREALSLQHSNNLNKHSHSHSSSSLTQRQPPPSQPPQKQPEKVNKTGFQRTSSGRLYTKDIETIFSMLMLSLELTPEGVKSFFFTKPYPFSFMVEDAVLRIQDMCVKIVVGTTRTSISCNVSAQSAILFVGRFMSARLLHCPADRTRTEPKPNIILQPTAKGVHFLSLYCEKNGIQVEKLPAVRALLESNHNSMQCFAFNRDPITDSVARNDSFVYLLFQRMMGPAPNIYSVTNSPDTIPATARYQPVTFDGPVPAHTPTPASYESPYAHRYFSNPKSEALSQYYISSKGVRLFSQKQFSKTLTVDYCVRGRAMWQWLLDCTDLVYQSEALHLVSLFIAQNIIAPISADGPVITPHGGTPPEFDRNEFYQLTDLGKYLVKWEIYANHVATPVKESFPATQEPTDVPLMATMTPPGDDSNTSDDDELWSMGSGSDKAVEYRQSMAFKQVNCKPVLVTTTPPSSSESSSATLATPKKPSLKETFNDPAMSWLFSEYLQENHCEENLQFYKDLSKFHVEFEKLQSLQRKAKALVKAMRAQAKKEQKVEQANQAEKAEQASQAKKTEQGEDAPTEPSAPPPVAAVTPKSKHSGASAALLARYETQIDMYIQACKTSVYVMYHRYLAPSAPCELNIDAHSRKHLVETITTRLLHPPASTAASSAAAVPPTSSHKLENLYRVSMLLDQIRKHVYYTMENDSLPKFLQSPLYLNGIQSIATMNRRKRREIEKEEEQKDKDS